MKSWLLMAAASTALVSGAQAASFDCAKAAAPVEKAICADKALSAADGKLAATYAADLNKVSEQGRTILRDGQRQWLAYMRAQCTDQSRASDREPLGQCLTGFYTQRQEALEKAVVTRGGLTFVRADIYKLRKERRDPGEQIPTTGWTTLEVAYPQIDGAKSPSEVGFNKLFQSQAKQDVAGFTDPSTDYWYGYDEISVTARLISVDTTSSFYGHGAAHPNSAAANEHWLRQEGRLLKAADVFVKGSGWERFIRDFCFRNVKSDGFVDKPEQIAATTKDPQHWSFDKDGLTVTFGQYEVGPYAEGMPTVLIPWSALKPYLAKGSPVGP